jgi:hypothetical protein
VIVSGVLARGSAQDLRTSGAETEVNKRQIADTRRTLTVHPPSELSYWIRNIYLPSLWPIQVAEVVAEMGCPAEQT